MAGSTIQIIEPEVLHVSVGRSPYMLVERSADGIIRATIRMYFDYFVTIIAIFALPIIPFQLIATWAEHEGSHGLYLLALVPTILIGPFVAAALTITVADICLGRTPSVTDSYRRSIKKLWAQLLATNLLTWIVIAIGLAMLIVPGVVFFTWYLLVPCIVVLEGLWGWAALRRSKTLVKGYFWHTLGTLIGLFMILFLVGVLAGVINLALYLPELSFKLVIAVLELAGQALAMLGIVLLYYDLRIRKEAYDCQTLMSDLMH